MNLRIALLAFGMLGAAPAWAQDCGGTGALADCDQDGHSVGDGDCDDEDAEVHPGRAEQCGDELDNNCDGFFDEECEDAAQLGSIRGGGGCTGGAGVGGAALLVLPVLVRRRRR